MTLHRSMIVVLALALAGCAAAKKPAASDPEVDHLNRLAKGLKLDMGKIEKTGHEKNMVGIRSEHVLFSKRVDSLTYFIQDDRYRADDSAGSFPGADENLTRVSQEVLHRLDVPPAEIGNPVIMTEKTQSAQFDASSKVYVAGNVKSGRRFVEFPRAIEGVPVFTSRALIGITRDELVGLLELHWPVISERTLHDARHLQEVVRKGWRPPVQKGATVESVEAGIIHSPALGFVMDVYPTIRVVYAAKERGIGRKPVLYLDEEGRSVPQPRTFEKMDEPPAGTRKATRR